MEEFNANNSAIFNQDQHEGLVNDSSMNVMENDNDCDANPWNPCLNTKFYALNFRPKVNDLFRVHLACYNEKNSVECCFHDSWMSQLKKLRSNIFLSGLHETGLNEMVHLLNAYPESATSRDAQGNLPLHLAANYCTLEVFKLIRAASPTAMYDQHDTALSPLLLAIYGNRLDLVDYIGREYPGCAEVVTPSGQLPLHIAALKTICSIFQPLILAYPKAIISPDIYGHLPIHLLLMNRTAINCNLEDSMEFLRHMIHHYPQCVGIYDTYGHTAYSLAVNYHYPDIVKRLLLRAMPWLGPQVLSDLNYNARRLAMFLGYCSITEEGQQSIWHLLRERDLTIFKHAVSYL